MPLVLMVALFLKTCLANDSTGLWRNTFILCLTALFVFIYLPSLYFYKKVEHNYNAIFTTHHVYHWRFPRASFETTMNPAPFANAIKLIDQYSHGTSIYMVSRYDNFLPFLSGKYLALPYSQLDVSIVSKKEFRYVIDTIQKNKPQYIFIDSDISDNHFSDILDPRDPLTLMMQPNNTGYNLSAGRVLTLMNLRDIFNALKNSYHKVATGDLISVYKRNNT